MTHALSRPQVQSALIFLVTAVASGLYATPVLAVGVPRALDLQAYCTRHFGSNWSFQNYDFGEPGFYGYVCANATSSSFQYIQPAVACAEQYPGSTYLRPVDEFASPNRDCLVEAGPVPARYESWGLAGDIPVPGNFFGSGRATLAVFRPSTGIFYMRDVAGPEAIRHARWGMAGDIPLAGDFMAHHRDQLAQFRPSNGVWYVLEPLSGRSFTYQWGMNGDQPLAGDIFGRGGQSALTVYRRSSGMLYSVDLFNSFRQLAVPVGEGQPVLGDFLGLSRAQVAMVRANGSVEIIDPLTSARRTIDVGAPRLAAALSGHFLGTANRVQLAIYDRENGSFKITDLVSGETRIESWGLANDIPFGVSFLGNRHSELTQFRNGMWYLRNLDP